MDFNVTDFNVRLRTIRIRELALAVIVAFIITLVIVLNVPSLQGSDDLMAIPFLALMLLFFAWALRGTHGLKDNFHGFFERDNSREILYIFLINLLFAFFFVALITNLDLLVSIAYPDNVPFMDMTPEALDPFTFLLEVVSSIIIAPVLEELMFRGVLFNRLKIRIGIIPAMLLSSAVFGIGHEFGGMTSAFLFGICMCIIYLKTDNILLTMSIHFLNNLVAVFLETTGFDNYFLQMPLAPITLMVSIIAGLLIIVYIAKHFKLYRASS